MRPGATPTVRTVPRRGAVLFVDGDIPLAEPQKSVVIAEIGAAHGVRGEVRVKAHTADPLAVADYGPLHDSRGTIFRRVHR